MSDDGALIKVDAEGVADVGKMFIEKISDAIVGLAKPWQTERVAKAEAKSLIVATQAEIDATELRLRAFNRFSAEQSREQANMESIMRGALPLLAPHAKPETLDNDWLTNLLGKARAYTSAEMQEIFSKILAGEANVNGSFSRRTINVVSDLGKKDAEIFTTLCKFSIDKPEIQPIILNWKDTVYMQHGIKYDTLAHLESLGLIRLESNQYSFEFGDQKPELVYFDDKILFNNAGSEDRPIYFGYAIFTEAGKQLRQIINLEKIPDFTEILRVYFRDQGVLAE